MKQNRDLAASFTFQMEGDETISKDPDDDGNWSSGTAGVGTLIGTKYGVSAQTLISWLKPDHIHVTPATMAGLTKDTAEAIFVTRFWYPINGDNLPAGPDLTTVDMGYNAGDTTAIKMLQTLIGVKVDGIVGDQTLAACHAFSYDARRLSDQALKAVQQYLGVTVDGELGPVTLRAIAARNDAIFMLCAALADAQLGYYQRCAGWTKYHTGWSNRVWARLEAALKLC